MSVDDPDRVKSAQIATLWHFYEEHAAQARQHENLRATVTSTLAAIAATVVGLCGVGGLSKADAPAAVVVILLGALGVALSLKHYERNRMHSAILNVIRNEIDSISPAGAKSLRKLREDGESRNQSEFRAFKLPEVRVLGRRISLKRSKTTRKPSPWVDGVRLHILWVGLPIGIAFIGVAVFAFSIIGVSVR
ncbi:hypothetical protein [Streptomyces sp. NPDC016845]|uniref:hypothetical protein n=1 Tax=Streptomyces sp. NPDC016845 TaxID=3364972 RepID=UPI0037933B09